MISMETRVDKYSSNEMSSRSARNARLYREVYGKYDNLENLPLEDNTDEIDMNRLKELIDTNNKKKEIEKRNNINNVIEQRKRNIDEQRVYDINKILEKAKYENNKLKETTPVSKIDTSILSTLESRKISIDELTNDSKKDIKSAKEDELSMTRELKFKGLSEKIEATNPLMEHVMPNNDLSLDLFDNLKPTENTIITEPIKNQVNIKEIKKETINNEEIDLHSGDTSDIDIIKNENNVGKENDFFTSSYEFSDSDFLDEPKRSSALKIILLFLTIIIFAGVIAYFVLNYGLGA